MPSESAHFRSLYTVGLMLFLAALRSVSGSLDACNVLVVLLLYILKDCSSVNFYNSTTVPPKITVKVILHSMTLTLMCADR